MSGIRENLKPTAGSTVSHSRKRLRCFRMQRRSHSTIRTIQTQNHTKLLSAYRQRAVCCFSHTASVGKGFGS